MQPSTKYRGQKRTRSAKESPRATCPAVSPPTVRPSLPLPRRPEEPLPAPVPPHHRPCDPPCRCFQAARPSIRWHATFRCSIRLKFLSIPLARDQLVPRQLVLDLPRQPRARSAGGTPPGCSLLPGAISCGTDHCLVPLVLCQPPAVSFPGLLVLCQPPTGALPDLCWCLALDCWCHWCSVSRLLVLCQTYAGALRLTAGATGALPAGSGVISRTAGALPALCWCLALACWCLATAT